MRSTGMVLRTGQSSWSGIHGCNVHGEASPRRTLIPHLSHGELMQWLFKIDLRVGRAPGSAAAQRPLQPVPCRDFQCPVAIFDALLRFSVRFCDFQCPFAIFTALSRFSVPFCDFHYPVAIFSTRSNHGDTEH